MTGGYFEAPPVIRFVREGDRWLVADERLPALSQVGKCWVDGARQYLKGELTWRGVADDSVSEYLARVCSTASDTNVLGHGGWTAAYGRVGERIFLAMCRSGEIRRRD